MDKPCDCKGLRIFISVSDLEIESDIMKGKAMMNYQYLGKNIQIARKRKGLKQKKLADFIGINLQSLSKIERGVNYPTYATLERIMEILEVMPNELLSGVWNGDDPKNEVEISCRIRKIEFDMSKKR